MAVRVKDVNSSAQRWSQRAGSAAGDYATEAVSSAERWLSNTVAAAQVFQQAVSASGVVDRYRAGLRRSGTGKYTRRINEHGQSRYQQGVSAGQQDWQTGFEPYASTIASLNLPQRRPRGDPGNLQRVQAVASALNARRLAGIGSM